MELHTIILLILGVLSSASLILSSLSTNKKHVILLGLLASLFYLPQYLMVGSTTSFVYMIIGMIRSTTVYLSMSKPILQHWLAPVTFIVAYLTAFYLLTDFAHTTFTTWLPLIAVITATIGIFMNDILVMKSILLTSSLSWIIFETANHMYTAAIGESLSFVSTIIAMTIIVKERAKGISDENITNPSTEILHTLTGAIPILETKILHTVKPSKMITKKPITEQLPNIQTDNEKIHYHKELTPVGALPIINK